MVRKNGNSRVSSRRAQAQTPPAPPTLPFGALGAGGNGINGALKRYGIEECPQCKASFNENNCRPVQDSCGHFKCRSCFISNEDGCSQCKDIVHKPRQRKGGPSAARTIDQAHVNGSSSISVDTSRRLISANVGKPSLAPLLKPVTNLPNHNHQHNLVANHVPIISNLNENCRQPMELSSVSEMGSSCLDPIYPGTSNLDGECRGLPDYSIHENSLLNSTSYSSIINQESEFSKSLMSLRTSADYQNTDLAGSGNSLPNGTRNHYHSPDNSNLDSSYPSVVPLGSTERGLITRGQLKEFPDANQDIKSAVKRKHSNDSNSNHPPKVVRFNPALTDSPPSSSTDGNIKGNDGSLIRLRSSKNINSTTEAPPICKRGPKFFRHGSNDRESLKNAAIANSQLGQVHGSSKRGSKGKADKKSSITANSGPQVPSERSSRSSQQITLPKPDSSSSISLNDIKSSGASPTTVDQKSNSRPKVLDVPLSPPSATILKPKITYGRSKLRAAGVSKSPSEPLEKPPAPKKQDSYATPLVPVKLTSPKNLEAVKCQKKSSPTKVLLQDDIKSTTNLPPLPSIAAVPSSIVPTTAEKTTELLTVAYTDICTTDAAAAPKPTEVSPKSTGKPENSTEPKDKKKKKRNPVIIHDHITVISGDPTMFQCNVCQKKFKTKAHIKYHEFCQNGNKPFKCEQCGQGFIAKSHYEYHLRTHTGERPYVCPKCGKGFNQRGKVTRHMRSHTGEKPFICSVCGRGFANAQALRSHHLIHTGERPFACKYCQKRFTGMTNLKKHIITHTGERPYVCTHCGKSFGLKWTLDLHLRTHSSERPYACDQCTRAFSNSKDLRRHLVIHSGERPFKCWICGTAFRRKDNLDRHIKNTHNQPKEVAKHLANEAAAEYLAANKSAPVPISKVNSAVISNVIRTAQFPQTTKTSVDKLATTSKNCDIMEEKSKKKDTKILSEQSSAVSTVIITAELSPRGAADEPHESESYEESYILPDRGDYTGGEIGHRIEVQVVKEEENDSGACEVASLNELVRVINQKVGSDENPALQDSEEHKFVKDPAENLHAAKDNLDHHIIQITHNQEVALELANDPSGEYLVLVDNLPVPTKVDSSSGVIYDIVLQTDEIPETRKTTAEQSETPITNCDTTKERNTEPGGESCAEQLNSVTEVSEDTSSLSPADLLSPQCRLDNPNDSESDEESFILPDRADSPVGVIGIQIEDQFAVKEEESESGDGDGEVARLNELVEVVNEKDTTEEETVPADEKQSLQDLEDKFVEHPTENILKDVEEVEDYGSDLLSKDKSTLLTGSLSKFMKGSFRRSSMVLDVSTDQPVPINAAVTIVGFDYDDVSYKRVIVAESSPNQKEIEDDGHLSSVSAEDDMEIDPPEDSSHHEESGGLVIQETEAETSNVEKIDISLADAVAPSPIMSVEDGELLDIVADENGPLSIEEGELIDGADKGLSSISSDEYDYEPAVETQEASQQTDLDFVGEEDENCKVLIGRPVSILLGIEGDESNETFARENSRETPGVVNTSSEVTTDDIEGLSFSGCSKELPATTTSFVADDDQICLENISDTCVPERNSLVIDPSLNVGETVDTGKKRQDTFNREISPNRSPAEDPAENDDNMWGEDTLLPEEESSVISPSEDAIEALNTEQTNSEVFGEKTNSKSIAPTGLDNIVHHNVKTPDSLQPEESSSVINPSQKVVETLNIENRICNSMDEGITSNFGLTDICDTTTSTSQIVTEVAVSMCYQEKIQDALPPDEISLVTDTSQNAVENLNVLNLIPEVDDEDQLPTTSTTVELPIADENCSRNESDTETLLPGRISSPVLETTNTGMDNNNQKDTDLVDREDETCKVSSDHPVPILIGMDGDESNKTVASENIREIIGAVNTGSTVTTEDIKELSVSECNQTLLTTATSFVADDHRSCLENFVDVCISGENSPVIYPTENEVETLDMDNKRQDTLNREASANPSPVEDPAENDDNMWYESTLLPEEESPVISPSEDVTETLNTEQPNSEVFDEKIISTNSQSIVPTGLDRIVHHSPLQPDDSTVINPSIKEIKPETLNMKIPISNSMDSDISNAGPTEEEDPISVASPMVTDIDDGMRCQVNIQDTFVADEMPSVIGISQNVMENLAVTENPEATNEDKTSATVDPPMADEHHSCNSETLLPGQISPQVVEASATGMDDGDQQMPYYSTENGVQFYYQSDGQQSYETGYYPSQIQFVYPNCMLDSSNSGNNLGILYAAAAATAERNDDESGPPVKVRLLYAEALGVRGTDQSDQQLFYTSTTPNQEVQTGSSSRVQLGPPAVIYPPSNGNMPVVDRLQYSYVQDLSQTAEPSSSYPVQISHSNGMTHIQTITDHPDTSRLLKRAREAHHLLPQEVQHYNYNLPNSYSSQIFNDPSHQISRGPEYYSNTSNGFYSSLNEPQFDGPEIGYDPLRALAAEATRRLGYGSREEGDATMRAAAAIAAVGEAARIQRQQEQLERRRESEAEQNQLRAQDRQINRGPRKNYLSHPSYYQD